MLASLISDRSLRPMGVYATVSQAPADADDTLNVLWTSASDGIEPEAQGEEIGIRWASRGGVLPVEGDDTLLFIDSRGDPWAICWPSGTAPSFASAADLTALTGRVAALEAARTVAGMVTATGSPVGSGFTVSKTGTGAYTITFTTPFSGVPRVTFGLGATSGTAGIRHSAARTASAFSVVIYNTSGTQVDGEFDFNAQGPA